MQQNRPPSTGDPIHLWGRGRAFRWLSILPLLAGLFVGMGLLAAFKATESMVAAAGGRSVVIVQYEANENQYVLQDSVGAPVRRTAYQLGNYLDSQVVANKHIIDLTGRVNWIKW